MRVSDLVELSARRYPHRLAVSDEQRVVTYSDFLLRSRRVANGALGIGCSAGDRVAVLMHNSVEYAEVIIGLAAADVVAVHVSDRLGAEEMGHILTDSNARTAIFHADMSDRLAVSEEASGWQPALPAIVVGTSPSVQATAYEEWLTEADSRARPQVTATPHAFYLGYTSGTTGKPKGARITHSSRTLTAIAACAEYGLTAADVTLMFTPMHHGGPLVFVLTTLGQGGHLVIMRRFDPERAVALIEEKHITNAFVVPTILHRLAAVRADPRRVSPRVLISNAAPLPTVVKEATLERFPNVQLHEFYGSTEAGIVTNLRPEDQMRKTRCAGQPFLLTEVAVLGDSGEPVATGEVGELFSRSPYLFDGYHNLPEASAEVMHNGMVTAGDMARVDDEGYVYIVDRKRDVIISGGVNIYPREIEEVLLRSPEIAEVAVIGVPDPEWGERVKAYVVLRDPALDPASVVSEAAEPLASLKRPRLTEAVPALPRNSTGKLLKRKLRELAWRAEEAQI
jgi:acyl-CoA synthetase (AMP-forming)/AMP-acid ligase II